MLTADHDKFIVEQLKEDPEFLELYIEDTMKEKDPILFREGLQYIIKAKGFDLPYLWNYTEKQNSYGNKPPCLSGKLKAISPSSKVVIITDYGNEMQKEKAFANGVTEFMDKPLQMATLKTLVASLLDE